MQYRVKEKCFIRPRPSRPDTGIDSRLLDPDYPPKGWADGENIIIGTGKLRSYMDYDGPPGPHLEPMDEEAVAATEAFYATHPEAKVNVIHAGTPLHDTKSPEEVIAEAVAKSMAEAMKAQDLKIAESVVQGVQAAMSSIFSNLPGSQNQKAAR